MDWTYNLGVKLNVTSANKVSWRRQEMHVAFWRGVGTQKGLTEKEIEINIEVVIRKISC
jgi:hypothetical protein